MYGTSARILGTHYVAIQKGELQNSNFQMGLTVKCKTSTKIFNKNVGTKQDNPHRIAKPITHHLL